MDAEDAAPPPTAAQRAYDLIHAAAMLYAAHEQVAFDTDEDREIQRRLLAKAAEMCPDLPLLAAQL